MRAVCTPVLTGFVPVPSLHLSPKTKPFQGFPLDLLLMNMGFNGLYIPSKVRCNCALFSMFVQVLPDVPSLPEAEQHL